MTTVTFAPGSDHDNYFNCFTEIALNIEKPEGITCPEDTVSNYTISDLKSETGYYYLNA